VLKQVLITGGMFFLLPNQQRQSTEGLQKHYRQSTNFIMIRRVYLKLVKTAIHKLKQT